MQFKAMTFIRSAWIHSFSWAAKEGLYTWWEHFVIAVYCVNPSNLMYHNMKWLASFQSTECNSVDPGGCNQRTVFENITGVIGNYIHLPQTVFAKIYQQLIGELPDSDNRNCN